MSLAAAVAPSPAALGEWPAARRAADWTIGVIAFLGAFVMEEPAPYELVLCLAFLVWSVFGLRLNRHMAPMVVLLLLYVAGGFIALTQLDDPAGKAMYMGVTAFMALSAIFFAAVVSHDTTHRLGVVKNAYIASALVASLLGIAGYFHLFPGADAFTLYDRIKATFKDPNVFGPFLVLPIVFIVHDILTSRFRDSLGKAAILLVLMLAVFLAFSRAAWGMTAFAIILVAGLGFLTERKQSRRLRIVVYFALCVALVAVLVAVALSIPAVSSLFEQRAQLVESYDSGHLGRFSRHILGFFLVQQHPLGIGPLAFAKLFGEDEHNMWLKSFTTYGWLGGFSYIILVLWTLYAAGRLLLKPRPWQPYLHCIFAVYAGQVMIHNVIDNDHWRHLFMLYGLLWGIIAADRMYLRAARRDAAPARPAPVIAAAARIERAPAAPAIPRAATAPATARPRPAAEPAIPRWKQRPA